MIPDQWTSFFTLVGSGSAALAGLVFVAITINLRGLAEDPTHRYRAINMLTGFSAAFIVSALVEMGQQTPEAIGLDWLVVAVPATVINTNGYIRGYRLRGSSRYALSAFRIAGGSLCYAGQILGSVLLVIGDGFGITIAAIALVANFAFLISGSWLLIVGTLPHATGGGSREP
jgi:hypothetical protein